MSWPESPQGTAARLIIRDIAEFGDVMTAAADAGMWSVERALQRLLMERIEVLIAIPADAKFAKRYCDSVKLSPEPDTPTKPRKRARPEDAFAALERIEHFDKALFQGFREAFRSQKDIASDWFVHPTAMGPLHSLDLAESTDWAAEMVDSHWEDLVRMLGMACGLAVSAASVLGVTVEPELVKGLDAAARCISDESEREALRDIHSTIVERV